MQELHFKRECPKENFKLPSKAYLSDAGFDIYMPEAGSVRGVPEFFPLGFSVAIPEGYMGLLLPRSSTGTKHSLELTNTCGVIDSGYRGQVMASMRTKNGLTFKWDKGDKILQLLIVPVPEFEPKEVDNLPQSYRDIGGFGSSGK